MWSSRILEEDGFVMQSNAYTLFFTAVVTVLIGFLLSITAKSLEQQQQLNEIIDIKKNILRSLDFKESVDSPWTQEEVQDLFAQNIVGYAVNSNGEKIPDYNPDQRQPNEDVYPIFCSLDEQDSISGVAIHISGKGLWSTLYGYIALEPDGYTVKGITFYKHKETPGLGGEVEKKWFTDNFKGKRIMDENGNLIGIQVLKGQVDLSSPDAYHQVDGISGATMTTKGLNAFLLSDLKKYEPFLKQLRQMENS